MKTRVMAHVGRRCEVPDCFREHAAHGLCHGHYQRLRGHGDIRPEVPLRDWKQASPARPIRVIKVVHDPTMSDEALAECFGTVFAGEVKS